MVHIDTVAWHPQEGGLATSFLQRLRSSTPGDDHSIVGRVGLQREVRVWGWWVQAPLAVGESLAVGIPRPHDIPLGY
jgi:hypothetical protein